MSLLHLWLENKYAINPLKLWKYSQGNVKFELFAEHNHLVKIVKHHPCAKRTFQNTLDLSLLHNLIELLRLSVTRITVSYRVSASLSYPVLQNVFSAPRGNKILWSFVKKMGNNASSSIPTLIRNDQIFTNPINKTNLSARFELNSVLAKSNHTVRAEESISYYA